MMRIALTLAPSFAIRHYIPMSKEVDALILIGHSSRIVNDTPGYAWEDVGMALQYVQEGRETWYTGKPITDAQRSSIHASNILLSLDSLALSVFKAQPVQSIDNLNPYKLPTLDRIHMIGPYRGTEVLRLPVTSLDLIESESRPHIPELFEVALKREPKILQELMAKWAISKQIHAERGTTKAEGYDAKELADGIGTVNIDEIAPQNITDSSYDLEDIIDHAGVQSRIYNFPYYAMLDGMKNGEEMLRAALEDLQKVSDAIR